MELVSRRQGINSGRITSLKRSRSFRASVKLMSKIRNRTEAYHELNSNDKSKPTRESIVSREFIDSAAALQSISRDLTTKLSLTCPATIKKDYHTLDKTKNFINQHDENNLNNINNQTNWINKGCYENPSFALDNSLDSSLKNYLFPSIEENVNEYFVDKNIDNTTNKLNKKLTIIVGQKHDGNITFDNKDNQKKNEDNDNTMTSWFNNRATSFRRKPRVNTSDQRSRPLIDVKRHSIVTASTFVSFLLILVCIPFTIHSSLTHLNA